MYLLGNHIECAVVLCQLSNYPQYWFSTNCDAVSAIYVRPGDYVDHAGIIFQKNEREAFCSAWPLTCNYQPCNLDLGIRLEMFESIAAYHTTGECVVQEGEGMTARGKSEHMVLGE